MDADEDEGGIFARYDDLEEWQQFAVEKDVCPKFLEASPCKLQAIPSQERETPVSTPSRCGRKVVASALDLEVTPKPKRRRFSDKSATKDSPCQRASLSKETEKI